MQIARRSVHRFATLSGVADLRRDDDRFSLSVAEPHVVIPELLTLLRNAGAELTRLTTRQASLEDVFVKLTGRHLADEQSAAEGG